MVYLKELSFEEESFVQYVVLKLKEKGVITSVENNQTKIQKILVYVADNLNFPLTRAWYRFGYSTSAGKNIQTTFSGTTTTLFEELKGYDLRQPVLDDTIDKGSSIYSSNNAKDIRLQQYRLYDNDSYKALQIIQANLDKEDFDLLAENTKALVQIYCDFQTNSEFPDFREHISKMIILFKRISKSKQFEEYSFVTDTLSLFIDVFCDYNVIITAKGISASKLKSTFRESLRQKKGNFLNSLIVLKRKVDESTQDAVISTDTKVKAKIVQDMIIIAKEN
ncbi:MAG: hypothetical protein ACI8Y7_000955 [Candidatus Woesearchaeota archaeon]|jgi:hypothetical protein